MKAHYAYNSLRLVHLERASLSMVRKLFSGPTTLKVSKKVRVKERKKERTNERTKVRTKERKKGNKKERKKIDKQPLEGHQRIKHPTGYDREWNKLQKS
jgi:hypothetical protein